MNFYKNSSVSGIGDPAWMILLLYVGIFIIAMFLATPVGIVDNLVRKAIQYEKTAFDMPFIDYVEFLKNEANKEFIPSRKIFGINL